MSRIMDTREAGDGTDWMVPSTVTCHQLNKWQAHARERIDLAVPHLRSGERRGVVQAGACLGLWPFLLATEYHFTWVLSAEPDPDNFMCCETNLRDYEQIKVHPVAFGVADATLPWARDAKGRPGWHHLAHDREACVGNVKVRMIDGFLAGEERQVDLIALDVEGYELNALIGGRKTLRRDHPVIIVEDLGRSKHKSYRRKSGVAYGYSPGELQNWLEREGYKKVAEVKNDEVFAWHQ